MATSTTTATALHPQFRPPSHPRAPRRLRPCPSSSSSSVRPRFSVRAAAASTSASAPAQREAVAGVPWGCEIESLESAASLERWLTASGLPEQRLALERVDVGERGLVALKNVRNGEKLLFVPPTLVITADSVEMIIESVSSVTTPLTAFSFHNYCLSCARAVCRNGATVRWGM